MAGVTEAFAVRPALKDDEMLLIDMLIEAANWPPDRRFSRSWVLSDPKLVHYVIGWPREGDVGLVAENVTGEAVGAIWWRYFTATDPGYGYVDDATPEVTVGVVPRWRGRGIGRALVRALLAEARSRAVDRLCLSVERANPAMRLYAHEGFVTLSSGTDSDTMLWSAPPVARS